MNQNLQTKEEHMDRLRKDPILEIWKNNYIDNLKKKRLEGLNVKPIIFLFNNFFYNNVPVVLVGAGPSLDKNINKLKAYQDNAIIVCTDMALFKVIKEGIKPDFVVNVDPSNIVSKIWEKIDTKNMNLVCPTTTHKNTIDNWEGNIFLYNQIDIKDTPKGDLLSDLIQPTKKFGNFPNRYFVGATAFQLSHIFKPSIVILMGYDFAYTNDKLYCEGVLETRYPGENLEEKTKKVLESDNIKEIDGIKTNKVMGEVYPNVFTRMLDNSGFKTINCTEGGIFEYSNTPLEKVLKKYCSNKINKVDVFKVKKRKRRKKK